MLEKILDKDTSSVGVTCVLIIDCMDTSLQRTGKELGKFQLQLSATF
jgi:hypothetical protein